jgi:hypothetical protein
MAVENCSKCNGPVYAMLGPEGHTNEYCDYWNFLKEMEQRKYVQLQDSEDIRTLLTVPSLGLVSHKWMLSKNPAQGFILNIYAPKWIKNAIALYYEYQYSDLTLVEFLQKMQ